MFVKQLYLTSYRASWRFIYRGFEGYRQCYYVWSTIHEGHNGIRQLSEYKIYLVLSTQKFVKNSVLWYAQKIFLYYSQSLPGETCEFFILLLYLYTRTTSKLSQFNLENNKIIKNIRKIEKMYKRNFSHIQNPHFYNSRNQSSHHLNNLATALSTFDHSVQLPYRFNKDDSAANLSQIQQRKVVRGHGRNYSDLVPPTLKKTQSVQFQDCQKTKQNKINNLEYRVLKIEEKLFCTENKIMQLNRKQHKCHQIPQQKFVDTFKIQQKIKEFNTQLSDLKQKLTQTQKMTINSPINPLRSSTNSKPELNFDLTHEKVDRFVEKINQINLQLIDSLKREFKQKINELNQKVKLLSINKQYEQASNPENQFFKTNRKYSSNSISFIYEEYIRKNQKLSYKDKENVDPQTEPRTNSYCLNQITYYIDPEGFLLDQNSQYLVNSKLKQIKLSERQLKMLRKMKILQN